MVESNKLHVKLKNEGLGRDSVLENVRHWQTDRHINLHDRSSVWWCNRWCYHDAWSSIQPNKKQQCHTENWSQAGCYQPKLWVVWWFMGANSTPPPIEHPVCIAPEKLFKKNNSATSLSYSASSLGTFCTIGGPALRWSTCQPLTPWHNRWTVTGWSHPRARFTPSASHPNVTFSLWYQWDVIIVLLQDSCHLSWKCQQHFWCYF